MATGALAIKLRCASWQQLATIYRRDLSRGTMFLKASVPPAIGTSVRIDLALPSGSVIVLNGTVDHHVDDETRGAGVELKLAPIPTGSIWLIESALTSEAKRRQTPAAGVPITTSSVVTAPPRPTPTGPVMAMTEGQDQAAAEVELIRALVAEAESLKKLNPFLVLGLGYEASDAEVRAAFAELTKRYHPDRFARYQSVELRQVAAEIFILIRDAYRRLGDDTGRQQVLASLGRPARVVSVPAVRPPQVRAVVPIHDRPSGAIRNVVDGSRPTPPPPPGRRAPSPTTERRSAAPSAPPVLEQVSEASALEDLIDEGRLAEALAGYKALAKKQPQDRSLRAGIELCEGLAALAQRDRLEAAQRFEAALEIDPSNERAARELADMRRQATNERKGLLSRLMGKKEPP